jgi:MFS family permease
MPDRLFTPRFFLMCGFSFTVFLSAFQLFPTAPVRILALGGSTAVAGLFLGLLTYASAFSGPVTGALADRFGSRRVLLACGTAITGLSMAYGLAPSYAVLLGLAFAHGIFWSGLLSASASYAMDLIPESRRAEGIAYWGLATVFAVAIAPSIGLWVYEFGWSWVCAAIGGLNLAMVAIAWRLPEPTRHHQPDGREGTIRSRSHWLALADLLEWRVTVAAVALFLAVFGHGGVTSFVAIYAREQGAPAGLYFTAFAISIALTRTFVGRLADRVGHVRVLVPCLALTVVAYGILAMGGRRPLIVASALVHGAGLGSVYPVFAAHVMKQVDPGRRGAAFGGMLAAFETGLGTGSIALGWLANHLGFPRAFAVGAAVATLSVPYLLLVEPRVLRRPQAA